MPAEKKMFGGLSFLVGGSMCCGVMGEDLLIRLGAETADGALAGPAARPFDMGRGPGPDGCSSAPAAPSPARISPAG